MEEVTPLSAATGNCVVCGESAEGSVYWTPPPKEVWDFVRPIIEKFTPVSPWSGVKLVQSMYFIPDFCKPFCSPACVAVYYKRRATEHCKRGG